VVISLPMLLGITLVFAVPRILHYRIFNDLG
jgi:hypothetical protein